MVLLTFLFCGSACAVAVSARCMFLAGALLTLQVSSREGLYGPTDRLNRH